MEIEKQKNIKGFTLIELLVSILIIGILVSISFSQYKKTKIKAQMAGIKQTVAAIRESEERYYLSNHSYAVDASSLDIGIQYEKTNDSSLFIYDNAFVIDLIAGSLSQGSSRIDVYYCPNKVSPWQDCTTTHKHFLYSTYLKHSTKPGKTVCSPYTDLGTQLCKMLK